MTGQKTNIGKRGKVKDSQEFRDTKKLKETAVSSEIDDATPGTLRSPDSSSAKSDTDHPISASRSKMSLPDSDASSESSKESDFQGQGYRIIDWNKFSSSLTRAHVCVEGKH